MKTKRNITRTEVFELVVDGIPVTIHATSYQTYTMETHYRVSINGSPVYIFAWHPELKRFTAVNRYNGAGNIPPQIEEAIGQQLYMRMAA